MTDPARIINLARRRIGKAEKPSTFRDMEQENEDAPLFVAKK